MKVTFIIRNVTDVFYEGRGDAVKGINQMDDRERFYYLNRQATVGDLRDCVSMKVGRNNSMQDKADLNLMLRKPCTFDYKLEPRKGYRLATFEIKEVA